MKIRCERDALVEALSVAGRAVTNRAAGLPVLNGVLVEARDDEIKVTGTDLDLTMEISVPAVIRESGKAVVPAKLVTDIVRAMPPGAVDLECVDDEARVQAGKSQFAVRTLDVTEFPRTATPPEPSATLKASELADALRQVVRSASSDDARPVLTGVLLSAEESGLRLVATDSYRLAVRDLPGAEILNSGQSVLIPSKALSELTRTLAGEDSVQVALEDREISFTVGNTRLSSRLIEGQFPDYRPLLPSGYPNKLTVDRDVLLEAVRRVRLVVKDTTTPVRLALRTDSVELTVVSQEVGHASEEIEAKYEGDEITVAFNPSYLIDGLEAVSPGDVIVETVDALKPATIQPVEVSTFLYLIMPVRVS